MRVHYLVIQPSFNWAQPDAINSGTVISRHNSISAAKAAIDRAVRKLRKQAGMSSSWYDWHICAEEDGSAPVDRHGAWHACGPRIGGAR